MKNNNDKNQMNDNRIQSLAEYKMSHLPSHQAIHKNTEDTPMPKLKQTLGHTQATHNHTHKAPTMLGIKNLVKTYENGHQAVKGVSLDIDEGEFLVLVGPSGCGKSSILRSIAGLESISGGEIHLGGRRVDTEKPALRDIAMVFQNYALYPHMTVYKNLAYGLKNRGVSQHLIEDKIEKVAKTLKIEEYLDRKPAKLSGGQRQRVAMGRAIVRDPQLFLFDEPLSNLDASLRAHMRLEIKKLQRELGVTSVYVTHDQVEAMTLADRIVVLNNGQIEQVGTPREVYHQPASTFVASFIGSPAMNFLTATLDDGYLEIGDQQMYLPEYAHVKNTAITLGIRPEHSEACADLVMNALPLELRISVVEPLGPNQLVHGLVNEQPFIAVTPETTLCQAVPLGLSIDKSNLHIFDNHGKRIHPNNFTSQESHEDATSLTTALA
ncbi:sn-glycerol-3-phosphate import ATP-binding protein UgpC [Vibrio splendidus]|uniref:sn-glycerol-3-phosphate import ATP-binding protein UgpC n=1 Tax=Vibrio splendidus TaxID=29497 RepID=UPI000C8573F7|nr:sn-glycerol-3-phosphate import ATP-binding protein UgpC [Vibrio splendidus]PMO71649.1 sn-glycerol-3-phosphate ABC transporter ATP-binding protein UgpC [Vibrio splendidus]